MIMDWGIIGKICVGLVIITGILLYLQHHRFKKELDKELSEKRDLSEHFVERWGKIFSIEAIYPIAIILLITVIATVYYFTQE
jgi:hypothetical protein